MRSSATFSKPAVGFFLGSCLLAFSTALAAEDKPTPLGAWGDPNRVVVEGATTFGNRAVKSALFKDLDLLLAAHPAAPLPDYFPALREQTAIGYHHGGFLDVVVTTQADILTDQVTVRVEEGPCYLAGDIRVSGAASIPADLLIDRLKKPRPPAKALPAESSDEKGNPTILWLDQHGRPVDMQDPAWQPGEPVQSAERDRELLRERIQLALKDLGFFFATYSEDLVREPDRALAHLEIRIENQGHQALADDVEILGNQNNIRQEILAYLELKPGDTLTRLDHRRLEYRLWQSGRFTEHHVTPVRPDSPDQPLVTRIELNEYAKAPRLSEELTAEEKTLLKFGRWCTSIGSRGEDVVWQMSRDDRQTEVVCSPKNGILMLTHDSTENRDARSLQNAVVFSAGLVGCYSAKPRKRLCVPVTRGQVTGNFTLGIDPAPKDPKKPFRFKFTLSMKASDKPVQPFRLTIGAAPVFFLAPARNRPKAISWEGDVLVVASPEGRLRIDGTSGKLLEFLHNDPSSDRTKGRLTLEEGRFESLLAEIESATADYPNVFDPKHRWTSIARFLFADPPPVVRDALDEAMDDKTRERFADRRAWSLLWEIVGQRLLEVLDKHGRSHRGPDSAAQKFEIPRDYRFGFDNPLSAFPIASLGILAPDTLFARRSWPWTLWRETTFLAVSRPRYAMTELNRIYKSPTSGPVALLLAAAMASKRNPKAANMLARRGLERLTLDYFRLDYNSLFADGYLSREIAIWIAEDLRSIQEEDVELLDRFLMAKTRDSSARPPATSANTCKSPSTRHYPRYWTTAGRPD